MTKKHNGFSKCPDPLQIASYLAVFFFSLVVYGLALPVIPNLAAQIVLALIYLLVEVLMAWKALVLTMRDPTEQNTQKTAYYRSLGLKVNLAGTFTHFCNTCDSVVGLNVHHCRQCQRCVKDLDHHCKWINNCVDKNSLR